MNYRLAIRRTCMSAAAIAAAALPFALPSTAKAAGTPAGTNIVNQATSAYKDLAGNNYTSNSNTVTTTVQSAPSLTLTPGTLQTTVPGGQLTDTFTLTNTGNGSATFTIANPADTGTDSGSATIAAYLITYPAAYAGTLPTNCTQISSTAVSCTTLAAANASLALNVEASSNVVTVGVVYNVSSGATAGTLASPQTVTTNLSATTTQAAQAATGNGQAVTAATSTTAGPAVETDDVLSDARLDSQKYGIQPNTTSNGITNSTANIEYVVATANGGSVPSRDLQSVKTLVGGSAPAGVFFSDKLPSFGGTLAVVQSAAVTTSAANGYGGTSAAIYYTASTTGAGPWTLYSGSGALPSTTTFVGVLVSGTPNGEYGTNANSTSAGNVAIAKSAVTLTFYVSPPTGTGSGNANAYVNQVDAVNGGDYANLNPDAAVTNPSTDVVGPGVTTGTADSTSTTTAIDSGSQGILYPTPTTPGNSTAINASNAVANMAAVVATIFNGPYTVPQAVGSYNGVVTASNNNDNTAVSFTPAGFTPVNTASSGAPVGNGLTAAYVVSVPNTIQNVGNAADNIAVNITAPSGFLVAIYAANASGAATGSALGGSGTSNTASYTFPNVPSGSLTDTTNEVSYVVQYTVPTGATAFTPYDATLTAISGNNTAITNATHNDLIPGGPMALSKSVSFDATTCPSGTAVPGCIMTYAITYLNNAAAAGACPSTAPAASAIPSYLNGYYVKLFNITENGATAPNTWGATYTNATGTHYNTTGLTAAATDTNTASTFTGNTAGSYSFVDNIGGTNTTTPYVIAPGCSGTLTFKVTVNTL